MIQTALDKEERWTKTDEKMKKVVRNEKRKGGFCKRKCKEI